MNPIRRRIQEDCIDVTVVGRDAQQETSEKLFFVNLGGYAPDVFGELTPASEHRPFEFRCDYVPIAR